MSALTVCLLAGTIWQAHMVKVEKNVSEAVGETVDVGAYKARCYRNGDGDAAVVFIAGSGTPCAYTDFYLLENALPEKYTTLAFDHAGSGGSTATDVPRTLENLTNELARLIDATAAGKPVVLVCHSLGALEAIGFAQRHPERVAGIVFIDSGSPEFYSTDSEFSAKALNRASAFLRMVGAVRLLGDVGVFLPLYGENIRNPALPGDVRSIDRAMFYRFAGNPATFEAVGYMNENAADVMAGPRLGDIPILVLSSDSGDNWDGVQSQLAGLSDVSERVTIKGAGHYLHWYAPSEVSERIAEFISDILHTE